MAEIDSKERIKLRAHDMVMQYGMRSVSMDDLANSLGISKKTIYQYYADKDELMLEVVESVLARNQQSCERDKKNAENAIHEIFLAMDMIAEMFRTMNPSLMFDMQKYHPDAYTCFQKHKNEYLFNTLRKNLVRGIEEGLYREEMKVDVVARFRVESMLIAFHPEFLRSTKHPLAVLQQELLELFLYGLVNSKGHKMIAKYKQQREKKYEKNAKTY